MKPNTQQFIQSTLLGMTTGLISTWIMSKSQAQMKAFQNKISEDRDQEERHKQGRRKDPSTVKLANKISRAVVHHPIPRNKKNLAGQIVHYGFGASMGALYGALNYKRHNETLASGLSFGVVVWLVADNVLVPLMGLAKPPTETTIRTHLYALGSHLVYGASLGKLSELAERRLPHGTSKITQPEIQEESIIIGIFET